MMAVRLRSLRIVNLVNDSPSDKKATKSERECINVMEDEKPTAVTEDRTARNVDRKERRKRGRDGGGRWSREIMKD